MAEAAGGPVAEEDESVVVSVGDKRAVLAKVAEPFYGAVGMENAVGERKLSAGRMNEIVEWNGEGGDGSIIVEFEGTSGPAFSFATVGRMAIVWDIRPDLNCAQLCGSCRGGEGEMAGVEGDVEDCGFAEGWIEDDHLERMERAGAAQGCVCEPSLDTRVNGGISLSGRQDNRQWEGSQGQPLLFSSSIHPRG